MERWERLADELGKEIHAIHANDAEYECRHGRLPTDSLRNLRCKCWDGLQMTKGQGDELRKELRDEMKAIKTTLDQMNLALNRILNADKDPTVKRRNGVRA